MGVIISVFIWLTLSVSILCCPDRRWLHYQHQIYVDNQTGINDPSCWEGGYSTPCLSLNLALKGAQYYNHSIAIHLQPGQHHLQNETQLWHVSRLAIVGNGSEGEVVIKCGPLAGLTFFWAVDIEVRKVSVIGCGAVQKSTSRIVTANALEFLQIQVAVQFCNCRHMVLEHIQVKESNGTGLVLYNSLGMVCIKNCFFSCSGKSVSQNFSLYGGGIVVESNIANEASHNAQSYLTIINTTFVNNTASSGQFSFLSQNTNPDGYFGLGRGGGLSVVFRESAAYNTVQLSGVRLESNIAQFGGGIFLAFYDDASFNTVTIDHSELFDNKAIISSVENLDIALSNGGGGLFITFAATNASWPFNNVVTITNSSFISNEAEYGGGIAVDVQNDQHTTCRCFTTSNKLIIDTCVFDKNGAFQGSSAHFSQDDQSLVDTVVCSSRFTNGHCSPSMKIGFSLPCSGTMLLQKFSILLNRTVVFLGNNESALELYYSSIELSPGTQLHFINNTAFKGAALHLVDCSMVIVNNNTALLFQGNVAVNRGGAIYAKSCSASQTGGRQCFIRHANSKLHPDFWGTAITFINNSASGTPNSIYMDSIRPCIWRNTGYQYTVSGANNTFCWRGWSYMNSLGVKEGCIQQLKSAPAYVNTLDMAPIFPGETVVLTVTMFDDWGRNVTNETTLHVQVISGHVYLQTQPVQSVTLSPSEYTTVTLLADCDTAYFNQSCVLSVGPPQLHALINVLFNSCKEATPWSGSDCAWNGICVQYLPRGIDCTQPLQKMPICLCPLTSNISFTQGTCLSIDDGNMTQYLASGSCPKSYHKNTQRVILPIKQLITSYRNLTNPTCASFREGRLCGSCAERYGVAFNSPDLICTHCESYDGVAIFVFFELLPVLIMMILLALFHINITNGFLNGFTLYSQILTLQFPGLGYLSWGISFYSDTFFYYGYNIISFTFVYSFLNLNFLTLYPKPFCIPHVYTAVNAITLQYVIAAFPLLFIALTYIWIQLYSSGNRPVVCITVPVHKVMARFWQKFKVQPSLIDTYAGLILLSYMRFANISVNLLQYTTVSVVIENKTESIAAFYYDANLDYFGKKHAAYGVLAIMCLLVFIVPPLNVLLFYHLLIFQRCLSWCKLDRPGLHALVDAYQGCFKNSATDGVERRYFAGIYLLFRLHILSAIFLSQFSLTWLKLIEAILSLLMAGALALLRPYRKTAHNVTDSLIFFFMSIIFTLWFAWYAMEPFYIGPVPVVQLKDSVLYFTTIPIAVLICYLTYRAFRWFFCTVRTSSCRKHQPVEEEVEADEQLPLLLPMPTHSEVNLTDYSVDDLFADRVLHPSGYKQ